MQSDARPIQAQLGLFEAREPALAAPERRRAAQKPKAHGDRDGCNGTLANGIFKLLVDVADGFAAGLAHIVCHLLRQAGNVLSQQPQIALDMLDCGDRRGPEGSTEGDFGSGTFMENLLVLQHCGTLWRQESSGGATSRAGANGLKSPQRRSSTHPVPAPSRCARKRHVASASLRGMKQSSRW